jgi:hypothetical protein
MEKDIGLMKSDQNEITRLNRECQKAYKDRLRKAGYKRIDVWVKPEHVSDIRELEKEFK